MICKNLDINQAGHLTFAGLDTTELAQKYGTPLYLMDEDRIRSACRTYLAAMRDYFPAGSLPLYASKAACFKHIYEIMHEEAMGIDLVSAGEIHTAVHAGFPMERAYFHGNNKTDTDIAYAIACGVGYFVVDGMDEAEAVSAAAQQAHVTQRVLLRLTPGIDPHTYAAVATGKVDSKFGAAIATGQAEELLLHARSLPGLDVWGFHCHVGSQVFDEGSSVYHDAAEIMLRFAADMQTRYGFVLRQLNLGGGFGVRYVESDPLVDLRGNIAKLGAFLKARLAELGLPMPQILLEPGRSIVADAGLTLYTVGTVKSIPGYKNYVSVDGGMTDNPRYALYGSQYTVLLANRATEAADFPCDVVGRCCESGDILQPKVCLPKPQRGDLLAVCTTGAYNYSMASNYNRIPRPPVVMLSDGKDTPAVRRETLDDLISLDC